MRKNRDNWSLTVEYVEEQERSEVTVPAACLEVAEELESILADLLMDYWLSSEAEPLSADVEPEPASRENYETTASK